jgi:hypothetical protein
MILPDCPFVRTELSEFKTQSKYENAVDAEKEVKFGLAVNSNSYPDGKVKIPVFVSIGTSLSDEKLYIKSVFIPTVSWSVVALVKKLYNLDTPSTVTMVGVVDTPVALAAGELIVGDGIDVLYAELWKVGSFGSGTLGLFNVILNTFRY